MPSMGLSAPPSTWYRPRNSRVRSMAATSFASSTTQMIAWLRRGSRQIAQVSCSLTLPQMSQNFTLSRTSIRICASRVVSKLCVCRMWNAMRCADFGPMPGRRPSSSISSWTIPSYTRYSALSCAAAGLAADSDAGSRVTGRSRGARSCSSMKFAPRSSRTTASP